jgi:SET domain-containing protein
VIRIRARLKASEIHGIGLFADEFIPRGTLVWEFDPDFDPVLPLDIVRARAAIDPLFAAYAARYSYEEKRSPGLITFNLDDSRFMNDSPNPSLYVDEHGRSFAARDLQVGDELTNRYEDFLLDNDVALAVRWRKRED